MITKKNETNTPVDYVDHYLTKGYAIVRNFYSPNEVAEITMAADALKSEGLKHHASFRHKNLLFLIQQDPNLGKVLRFCHWPAYSYPVFAKYRNDIRILELLKPLFGENIKQLANQIIWKTPGASQTSYSYHQDARFRRPASAFRNMFESYVQTFIAIDRHTVENGCVTIIEGSHNLGDLKYHTGKSVFEEDMTDESLEKLGLAHLPKIKVLLEPGDLAFWNPYTLHGSGPNLSKGDRRVYTNGYIRAEDCDRGEWAFRNGKPVPLGEPVLVQYDDLYTKPEPHYIEGPPHPFKKEK